MFKSLASVFLIMNFTVSAAQGNWHLTKAHFVKAVDRQAPIVGDTKKDSAQNDFLLLVKALISTLDNDARARTLLPYNDPERLMWSRTPAPRKGLAIRAMSTEQRKLVDEMLKWF